MDSEAWNIIDKSNKKVISIFDYDGTITFVDSLIIFIYSAKGFFKTLFGVFRHLVPIIKYLREKISNKEIKEILMIHFFAEESMMQMQKYGEHFADSLMLKLSKKSALKRLREHLDQGHQCVLISATFDFYLHPWAIKHGFCEVKATKLEVTSKGKITGRVNGMVCMGQEKVNKFNEIIENRDDYIIYSYADSKSDAEILETADYPFYRIF